MLRAAQNNGGDKKEQSRLPSFPQCCRSGSPLVCAKPIYSRFSTQERDRCSAFCNNLMFNKFYRILDKSKHLWYTLIVLPQMFFV